MEWIFAFFAEIHSIFTFWLGYVRIISSLETERRNVIDKTKYDQLRGDHDRTAEADRICGGQSYHTRTVHSGGSAEDREIVARAGHLFKRSQRRICVERRNFSRHSALSLLGGQQKYVSDLELGKQKNIIAQELAGEIVKGSEAGVTKISKGLFRYAVEVEMIIMILSELADIPPKVVEEYRKEAIRNVRRTRGKINLDELIARNNREFVERKISEKGNMSDDIVNEYTVDDYDFMEDNI